MYLFLGVGQKMRQYLLRKSSSLQLVFAQKIRCDLSEQFDGGSGSKSYFKYAGYWQACLLPMHFLPSTIILPSYSSLHSRLSILRHSSGLSVVVVILLTVHDSFFSPHQLRLSIHPSSHCSPWKVLPMKHVQNNSFASSVMNTR